MENFLLVDFFCGYADEFDLSGWRVFTQPDWEKYKASIPNHPFELYFGTNQQLDFEDSDDFLACFQTRLLTSEQFAVLTELFARDTLEYEDSEGGGLKRLKPVQLIESGYFPGSSEFNGGHYDVSYGDED